MSPVDAFSEYRRFLDYLSRRRRDRSGDEDEDDGNGRSNAGPPPSWDGATPFKDYLIRAKLWLATTKVKPRSRGPLLLKNLSSTPFDDLKYLAKDDSWLASTHNGEQLLKIMGTKDLYGEDEREDMLQSLLKITYTLRRQKAEGHRELFSRWSNAVRKIKEHNIELRRISWISPHDGSSIDNRRS